MKTDDVNRLIEQAQCKTHPDAPHGFDRNASHNADRYVCECEGWEPVDKVDMSEERVHKSDKSMHEWIGLTNEEIDSVWKTEYFNLPYELPRAIEAKLKEKNT